MSAKKYKGLEGELYDLFRGGDDFDEIGFYIGMVHEIGGTCLDVGCGTGRVLIPIAHEGLDITGLDSSDFMVDECIKKIKEEDLQVNIIEGDMVDFDLGKKFNSLIVPGGSFQLINDRAKAMDTLENFRNHLNKNGLLVMSFFNPFYEISHESLDGVWRLEKDKEINEKGSRALCHTCMDLDRCEQIMEVRHRYELLDDNGIVEKSEIKTSMIRWYGKYEIELLLQKAGFSDVKIYGDFQDLEYEDGNMSMGVTAVVPE